MRKHSPFTYAANVRTPTLILHAREDRRCPMAMGKIPSISPANRSSSPGNK